MNPRSDVTPILIFSAHLWAGLSIGPFLPYTLRAASYWAQTVITVRVPSADISVLSINMKDAALYGKLIEDSML